MHWETMRYRVGTGNLSVYLCFLLYVVFMTFSVYTCSALVKLESGGCDQLEIDLLLASQME